MPEMDGVEATEKLLFRPIRADQSAQNYCHDRQLPYPVTEKDF